MVESLKEKTASEAWSKVLLNLDRYEIEIGLGKYFGGKCLSLAMPYATSLCCVNSLL
jgi:hypothetical protein